MIMQEIFAWEVPMRFLVAPDRCPETLTISLLRYIIASEDGRLYRIVAESILCRQRCIRLLCLPGEGISPTKEKHRAIVDAPVPEDISQLKYTLAPLYKLLTKHQPWSWGADQAAAFQKAKSQLTSDVLLVHFDPSKKIALSCDASPYGIGAVLSHLQEDGSDRPIAYASRSLAPAEKNYSQIEKEDGVQSRQESRECRWAKQIAFSGGPEEVPTPGDTILMLQAFSDMSSVVTATSIQRWTDKDPVLLVVRRMVLHGWRAQSNEQFKPYECRKSELSVEDGWSPPKSPLHPWEWPTKRWSRIHVDFCGPFLGKIIFVLVDAHSKWLEAAVVSSTSSQQAIRVLRQVFSCHGLSEVLVSDNGTAFTSTEFQTFVQRNGFRHIRSAPYHPATNGLAEQAVQTVKNALRKTSGDIDTCLSRFLFQHRLTPHSTTGRSLAELLLGRKPRSHLDFIFPSVERHVTKNQERQKENHDVHTRQRSFQTDKLNYPRHPAPPISEVEPDPNPVEEEAPPVADLEAVPLLPRRSTRPHRPPERYGL
eukprot:Em0010g580a